MSYQLLSSLKIVSKVFRKKLKFYFLILASFFPSFCIKIKMIHSATLLLLLKIIFHSRSNYPKLALNCVFCTKSFMIKVEDTIEFQ